MADPGDPHDLDDREQRIFAIASVRRIPLPRMHGETLGELIARLGFSIEQDIARALLDLQDLAKLDGEDSEGSP